MRNDYETTITINQEGILNLKEFNAIRKELIKLSKCFTQKSDNNELMCSKDFSNIPASLAILEIWQELDNFNC